jgi:hypothetical protein
VARAGFFDGPFGANKQHPRLQIMTIEALLNGSKPDLPRSQLMRHSSAQSARTGRHRTRECC